MPSRLKACRRRPARQAFAPALAACMRSPARPDRGRRASMSPCARRRGPRSARQPGMTRCARRRGLPAIPRNARARARRGGRRGLRLIPMRSPAPTGGSPRLAGLTQGHRRGPSWARLRPRRAKRTVDSASVGDAVSEASAVRRSGWIGRPKSTRCGPSRPGPMNGRIAQIPVVRRRLGERVKSTLCCPSRSGL